MLVKDFLQLLVYIKSSPLLFFFHQKMAVFFCVQYVDNLMFIFEQLGPDCQIKIIPTSHSDANLESFDWPSFKH